MKNIRLNIQECDVDNYYMPSKFVKIILPAVFCLFIHGCGQQNRETASLPVSLNEPDILSDSLMSIYNNMKIAAEKHNLEYIYNCLDPEKANNITTEVGKLNPKNLASDIARKISTWPVLDTLQLYEIKHNENYVRLSFTGPPYYSGYDDRRVRYTFLLFKKINNRWRLSTISGLEKELYGLYGYTTTYHETDLPSALRFPRRF